MGENRRLIAHVLQDDGLFTADKRYIVDLDAVGTILEDSRILKQSPQGGAVAA